MGSDASAEDLAEDQAAMEGAFAFEDNLDDPGADVSS